MTPHKIPTSLKFEEPLVDPYSLTLILCVWWYEKKNWIIQLLRMKNIYWDTIVDLESPKYLTLEKKSLNDLSLEDPLVIWL